MASNFSLFLFPIFLLLTSSSPTVSSYQDEIKITVNYARSLVSAVAPPVVAPFPAPTTPVATVPTPPLKAPTPPPPAVNPPNPPPPASIVKSKKDCMPLCDNRCQLHSRKKVCMRACTTCCERCKCVPPGTSGNREKCGKCYTDMITHGNRYKCP